LKKALVTGDPEHLFNNYVQPEPKVEGAPFPDKDDEAPGPEILPQ
jgi:hypothetical protein